jgi:hypothetical protein
MYCILQFPPDALGDKPKVEIALIKWMKDDAIKCPPNHLYTKTLQKQGSPLRNWKKYTYDKVLKNNISNYEDAKAEIQKYLNHTDTESEVECLRRKAEKKKHPVLSELHNNEYQDTFDNLKKKVNYSFI